LRRITRIDYHEFFASWFFSAELQRAAPFHELRRITRIELHELRNTPMKDPKTTTVAIIGGVILFALVGALILHKIDGPTFGEAAGAVGTFLGVLVGLFSADSKMPPTSAD